MTASAREILAALFGAAMILALTWGAAVPLARITTEMDSHQYQWLGLIRQPLRPAGRAFELRVWSLRLIGLVFAFGALRTIWT